MGFFNFGNNAKKEEKQETATQNATPAKPKESPYTKNGLVLKNVPIEKGVMSPDESYSSNLRGARSNAIGRLFTTNDLDYILRAYAPDTIETLDYIYDRQQNFYDWTKENINKRCDAQDAKIDELNKKIDTLLALLNEKQQNNNLVR